VAPAGTGRGHTQEGAEGDKSPALKGTQDKPLAAHSRGQEGIERPKEEQHYG